MEKLLRESEKCRYTSFYCTLLYNGFFFVCFTNWRSLATLCVKQVYWRHFPQSICSPHDSVSHFGNSSNISNFIITLVMVICDQWPLVSVWEHHKLHLYKTANNKCCVWSDYSTDQLFPASLILLLGLPTSWHTTILKLSRIITL